MKISILLNKEEKQVANKYAKLHSITLEEAFKSALFEKIENEYDLAIGEEAYSDYIKSGKESYPIEELWEESDL